MSINNEDLVEVIEQFVNENNQVEQTKILQRHPDLLKPEVMQHLKSKLSSPNTPDVHAAVQNALSYLETFHKLLSSSGFPEALHWLIYRTQLFEHAFSETNKPEYLDAAVEGWLAIFGSEAYNRAPPEFQSNALGSTAQVFLRRFQAQQNIEDIKTYIQLLQLKLDVVPDKTEIAMLFNNIGNAYQDLLSLEHSAEHAGASLLAYERALEAAAHDDPERERFLFGLCKARVNHYWHTHDPADIRAAMEAADEVAILGRHSLSGFLDNVAGILMKNFVDSGQTLSADLAIEIFEHIQNAPDVSQKEQLLYKMRLGRALLERSKQDSDLTCLNKAVDTLCTVTETGQLEYKDLLDALTYLSEAGGQLLEIEYTPVLGQRVLFANLRGLEVAEHLRKPAVLFTIRAARALNLKFKHTGELQDLDSSLQLLEEAQRLYSSDTAWRVSIWGQLGSDRLDRYMLIGGEDDLVSAIELLEEAIQYAEGDHPNKPDFLNLLAVAFRLRYHVRGTIEDLERSMSSSIAAIRLLPEQGQLRRAGFETNAGLTLLDHYNLVGDRLDEAIKSFEYALAIKKKYRTDIPRNELTNLGQALAYRYERSGNPEDLDQVIDCFENALIGVDPDLPTRLAYLNNLATALGQRLELRWDEATANRALELANTAVKLSTDDLPALPMYQRTLGDIQRIHFAHGLTDVISVISTYRRGIEVGMVTALPMAMEIARSWLQWAFERSAWAEVREAHELIVEVSQRLTRSQVFDRTKEVWLQRVQSMSAMSAFACMRLGAYIQAAEALEIGQAQMLREAFNLEALELETLRNTEHEDLLIRYRKAVDDLRVAAKDGKAAEARQAHERIEMAITSIRQIPGREHFFNLDARKSLDTASALRPLAYLAATSKGGILTLVEPGPDGEAGCVVRNLFLETFTQDALELQLYGDHKHPGFLKAYQKMLGEPRNPLSRRTFLDKLDELASWLWDTVMQSLLDMMSANHVTLVPVGLTALLPFHIAFESTAKARRYVSDNLVLTYAPNAQSIAQGIPVADRLGIHPSAMAFAGIAVSDNEPVLPNVKAEMSVISRHFETVLTLENSGASVDSVLAAMKAAQVAHFASHAQTKLDDPNQSFILLGKNQALTVDRLKRTFNLELRLAFLSACETARPGTVLPNEVIGLPSALIAAGVSGVIASSWAVTDAGALVFATRFYDEWVRTENPAEAFRKAQCWMRDAKCRELIDYLYDQREPGTDLPTIDQLCDSLKRLPPEKRPFAHAYHWGAFGYSGV